MVLVAHGHGGTAVAGHNLHGVLSRVRCSVRREEGLIDEGFVAFGLWADIAIRELDIIGYILCILSQ